MFDAKVRLQSNTSWYKQVTFNTRLDIYDCSFNFITALSIIHIQNQNKLSFTNIS